MRSRRDGRDSLRVNAGVSSAGDEDSRNSCFGREAALCMECDRAPRSGRAAISLPEESKLASAGLLRDPETVRLDGLADSADVMAAERLPIEEPLGGSRHGLRCHELIAPGQI
jgi:hypothetical protein